MLFPTLEFFIFFTFVFLVYWYVIPYFFKNNTKTLSLTHLFLLVVSYYFYMSWDWRFGGLILLSTVIDFVLAAKIHSSEDPKNRFILITVSLVLNLVFILGFFKYYNFFADSFNLFLGHFGVRNALPILHIILPVGISFYTFQSLSYTIDVYRRQILPEKSFLRFALFVSFFPQLVAGPIVTARTFLPQMDTVKNLTDIQFRKAIRYFIMGYIKKVVLSDNAAPIIEKIFADPANFGTAALWLAATLFLIQIYCDFSGYTDMAYASALFLGYELPENFRMPFIARSITEHWRRWHITLSTWLRDYVYISLGGNRAGVFRHRFNLWFTMFAAGFWHGAAWTFLIWGSCQGTLLLIEAIYRSLREKHFPNIQILPDRVLAPIQIFLTCFVSVAVGTWFRSESIAKELTMLKKMFVYSEGGLRPYMLKTGIPVILCVIAGQWLGYLIFEKKKEWNPPVWLEFASYPIIAIVLGLLTPDLELPFIYFQF
ncbi:MBOAT family O-acyltransferase [Leptospira alstonii]|uniref:Membrane-bound O-acyltransferase family MBOAT n=2 Tax=Leptospira alstonii TaxID=28452 RepID=M6CZR9_9LEPT|nr:MBOAT family O-acyltransferase [Leptospira alstonii]EMJ91815.1 membrane-bound O-acyltransferase family MBOAT [Leptospira alstonii serovar Sichuan str. 79601]EQA82113.1 membrane-bound O-acyltransferase family MBOAT [Leptospira alstonii serovar Pingchang str. 80-412]